jgi:hypothetical protein
MFVFSTSNIVEGRNITVPNIKITPCCNVPGYVPYVTIYLTENIYIFILPLNLILNYVVSILAGFNITVAIYSYRIIFFKKNKVSVVGSVGVLSGLFIGCPTCAGSIISIILGLGLNTTVAILSSFQLIFIIVTIPLLVIAPFLTLRSLNKCNIDLKSKENNFN